MLDLIFSMLRNEHMPPVPNLRWADTDLLPWGGLTLGTLVAGYPGRGKTSWAANLIVEYAKAFPRRAIFALDASGALKDSYFNVVVRQRPDVAQSLLRRTVNDELGHPDWVIPMPEFSPAYGTSSEEQVQRVTHNLKKLAPYLVKEAPILGGMALSETATELFRLLTAITNEHGECWQVTEGKKLLVNLSPLASAVRQYGFRVPQAKWYFENEYLARSVKQQERELRTYALRALLGIIESREVRARVGYHRPGWTPKEAIEKGQIVFVSGEKLTNRPASQHYLFTQVFSLIMAEVNKRVPNDPQDEPILLIIDETASLLDIEGMAEEIGRISPLYRSRKLELMILIQAFHQLDKELRKKVWSLGNMVSLALSDFEDAYEMAQQLFAYEPKSIKLGAPVERVNPIMEPDRGQYLQLANWIQRLAHRQCVIRRFFSEQSMDPYVRFVRRTTELPGNAPLEDVEAVRERVLRERAVLVRDALEAINQRNVSRSEPPSI